MLHVPNSVYGLLKVDPPRESVGTASVMQSPKRRRAGVPTNRNVYKEASQPERRAATLRGRKSVFATMSTYTATDVDEAPDVQHKV